MWLYGEIRRAEFGKMRGGREKPELTDLAMPAVHPGVWRNLIHVELNFPLLQISQVKMT